MNTQASWKAILESSEIKTLLRLALEEDIGPGDITTLNIFPQAVDQTAQLRARTQTVVCGIPVAQAIVSLLDSTCQLIPLIPEGQIASPGTVIAEFKGDIRSILTAERICLNFLMRLCGIATQTRTAQNLIPKHCPARVFDTRKTTPGWRKLEKMAVLIGGGANHREGLFDQVLIKDNHIAAKGSIAAAIQCCRENIPQHVKIEVEIDGLDQLEEALSAHPDIIMLDNFSLSDMRQAVDRVAGAVQLEASGGITLETLASVAETGVDRISMGALTHTVQPADLGLDMESPQS